MKKIFVVLALAIVGVVSYGQASSSTREARVQSEVERLVDDVRNGVPEAQWLPNAEELAQDVEDFDMLVSGHAEPQLVTYVRAIYHQDALLREYLGLAQDLCAQELAFSPDVGLVVMSRILVIVARRNVLVQEKNDYCKSQVQMFQEEADRLGLRK